MSNNLTGLTVSNTYGRLVQIVGGLYYDGFGNLLSLGGGTFSVGPQGATGSDGTSGTSGTSGVDGINGATGSNGTSGTSGINGATGSNGTSGTSGTRGATGSNGTSGTSGTTGTSAGIQFKYAGLATPDPSSITSGLIYINGWGLGLTVGSDYYVFISDVDANGNSVSNFVNSFDNSGQTTNVNIQDNLGRLLNINIYPDSKLVMTGGYRYLFKLVAQSSTWPSLNDRVGVIKVYNGIAGATGSAGVDGTDGTTIIEIKLTDLLVLIGDNALGIGVIYKIEGCDIGLYDNEVPKDGGTVIFLQALENNKLSQVGTGIFYTPKYENYDIFDYDQIGTYVTDDIKIWGGYCWKFKGGGTNNSIDLFNLETSDWSKLTPSVENLTYYNTSYDEIKYDITNDRIIYRNEKNVNIVSTNFDNIKYWEDANGLYNPIKVFQWGRIRDIYNQNITDSYNENINMIGSQYNIIFNNLSYQRLITNYGYQSNFIFDNGSYQIIVSINTNSYQDKFTFNNGYQDHSDLLTSGTNYQSNINIDNSYQSNINLQQGHQSGIYLIDLSYQNTITLVDSNQENIHLSSKSSQESIGLNTTCYQHNLSLKNSYQSNFNFNNSSYQDLTVLVNSNQSNFDFNSSYQVNTTLDNSSQNTIYLSGGSYQDGLKMNLSSQTNVSDSSYYQKNITFNNYTFDRGSGAFNGYEDGLFYIGNLPSDNSAPYLIGKINNQLVEVDINSISGTGSGGPGTPGATGATGPAGATGSTGATGPMGSFNGDVATFSSIWATNSSFVNLNLQTTNEPISPVNGDIYFNGTHSYLYSGTWSQISVKSSNIITVQKNGGDFTSVKTAVDSINDSSSSNGYIINVGPGDFYEEEIDFTGKPYISVVGSDIQITKIIATSSNQNLFILNDSVELSFMTLKGVGSGYAAIVCQDINGFSLVHKLSMYDCDTMVLVSASTDPTTFYGEYIDFNGDYSYGIKVESENGILAFANAENYYNLPGVTGSIGNFVTGTNSVLNILGAANTGVGNDKAFYIQNGAELTITSCDITGYEKGVEVGNVGTASTFDIDATSIVDCDYHLYVDHPNTFGTFQGSSAHSKIYLNPDNSTVYWGFLDSEDGEFDVTRKISLTNANGSHVDISTLILEGSGMGVLNGGDISTPVGLTVSISAGYGYLESIAGYVIKIEWPTTLFSVADDSAKYLYINENSLFSQSNTLPDIESNIVFGRVITQGGSIILIDNSKLDVHHVGNKLKLFTRNALGSIYDSGSIVTAATYSLNVTDGSYYFSSDHYLPSGGTGITFSQYVRNGSSWTITDTNVVTSQYDNNTGSLVGMSASYFTKHTLYVSGDGVNQKYLLVIGQSQYDNILSVEGAALPNPPTYFIDSVTPIASIVVRQGTSTIYNILDIRPVIGFKSTGVNSSSLHSNLIGLSADDHTQYLLVSGSRAMAGNLIMGSNSITGVGQVNGITIESHASRHLPNGADPLATGIPETIGTTNEEGIQNAFARQDHIHAHGEQLGGTLHATASTSTAGFMSATDKTNLDTINTNYYPNTGGTITGSVSITGNLAITGRLIDSNGSTGTLGNILESTGTGSQWVQNTASFGVNIDGGGAIISTGIVADVIIPYDMVITSWTIIADQVGSIVIDIWKDTYANYPSVVGDSITGSAKPTITSTIKNQSSTLTGWTTTVSAGDIARFNVDSVSTITRINLLVQGYKI